MISSLIAVVEADDGCVVVALVSERTVQLNREKASLCLHLAIPGAGTLA